MVGLTVRGRDEWGGGMWWVKMEATLLEQHLKKEKVNPRNYIMYDSIFIIF